MLKLLENGFDINTAEFVSRRSALASASMSRSNDAISALLDKGASPDANEPANVTDALHLAAEYGEEEIVRALLDTGADPNACGSTISGALNSYNLS